MGSQWANSNSDFTSGSEQDKKTNCNYWLAQDAIYVIAENVVVTQIATTYEAAYGDP
jgi:hypothetical protein